MTPGSTVVTPALDNDLFRLRKSLVNSGSRQTASCFITTNTLNNTVVEVLIYSWDVFRDSIYHFVIFLMRGV